MSRQANMIQDTLTRIHERRQKGFEVPEHKTRSIYAVSGSKRTQNQICGLLGFNPDIHSGMVKGGFCVVVTRQERDELANHGIRIRKNPRK